MAWLSSLTNKITCKLLFSATFNICSISDWFIADRLSVVWFFLLIGHCNLTVYKLDHHFGDAVFFAHSPSPRPTLGNLMFLKLAYSGKYLFSEHQIYAGQLYNNKTRSPFGLRVNSPLASPHGLLTRGP